MWYLNPKNIILVILATLVIGLGITYLFQKAEVAILEKEKDSAVAEAKAQKATIDALRNNLKSIQAHQKRIQTIHKNTEAVRATIRDLPETPLGGKDAQKIQDAIAAAVTLFNTGGMRPLPGADEEILPAPSGTDTEGADSGTAEDGE